MVVSLEAAAEEGLGEGMRTGRDEDGTCLFWEVEVALARRELDAHLLRRRLGHRNCRRCAGRHCEGLVMPIEQWALLTTFGAAAVVSLSKFLDLTVA